jgi:hypothetical protein
VQLRAWTPPLIQSVPPLLVDAGARIGGSRRPTQESDQSFDVLGGGRQEELLSDELQPAQPEPTEADVTMTL